MMKFVSVSITVEKGIKLLKTLINHKADIVHTCGRLLNALPARSPFTREYQQRMMPFHSEYAPFENLRISSKNGVCFCSTEIAAYKYIAADQLCQSCPLGVPS